MSVKHQYTDAFSLERPEMLSGDAALLFQAYSGCTGNILSFYPSTSPCSIADPLTINDFFPTPQVCLLRLPLLPTCIFSCWIAKVSHATLLLLPSPFAQYVSRKESTQYTPTITEFQENIIMRCQSKPLDQQTRRWLVDALWLLVIYFLLNLPPCPLEIPFIYKQLSYNIKIRFLPKT